MTDTGLIVIHCTCNDPAVLASIADTLVANKLAACVQISRQVQSVYVWQGKTESTEEWVLVAKTARHLFERTSQAIISLHPYEVPEILAFPVCLATENYRKWMLDQLLPE